MTLWRRTRTEAAGAWRSARDDLDQPEADGAPADRPGPGYAEVTSAGLSTFGGAELSGGWRGPYGEHLLPRRLAVVSAFGVLAVAGAAGSYLAVAGGLGALVSERPAGAEPYPMAAEAQSGSGGERANSGFGRGTAVPGRAPAAPGTEAGPAAGTIRTLPSTGPSGTPGPGRTGGGSEPATGPSCCPNPPAPTPTDPETDPSGSPATTKPGSPADDRDWPEPGGPRGSSWPGDPDDEDWRGRWNGRGDRDWRLDRNGRGVFDDVPGRFGNWRDHSRQN